MSACWVGQSLPLFYCGVFYDRQIAELIGKTNGCISSFSKNCPRTCSRSVPALRQRAERQLYLFNIVQKMGRLLDTMGKQFGTRNKLQTLWNNFQHAASKESPASIGGGGIAKNAAFFFYSFFLYKPAFSESTDCYKGNKKVKITV